jgi:hypothetical protein
VFGCISAKSISGLLRAYFSLSAPVRVFATAVPAPQAAGKSKSSFHLTNGGNGSIRMTMPVNRYCEERSNPEKNFRVIVFIDKKILEKKINFQILFLSLHP